MSAGKFDLIVSELPLEERRRLLEKLKEQSAATAAPPVEKQPEHGAGLGLNDQYASQPLYFRFWFFIKSLFMSKSPVELFEESLAARLGRGIEKRYPGIYDYKKETLLPAFYYHLEKLRDAAHFFSTALDAGFNKDKGAFYGFLGSLEMENVHGKLQNDTDPEAVAAQRPEAHESELRKAVLKIMQDAFEDISGAQRDAMYYDSCCLFRLKKLAAFPFNRILQAFGGGPGAKGPRCSIVKMTSPLSGLNDILCSLNAAPPLPLLESLFIFLAQKNAGKPGFTIEAEVRFLLRRAEDAVRVIREFKRDVPLTGILRCALKNTALAPQPVAGGEDWFPVYRDYWKRRIDSAFSEFFKERRYRDLLKSFSHFLKDTDLKFLGGMPSDANPDGFPVRGAMGLSFLATFYAEVFVTEINPLLDPVSTDGLFRRDEDRAAFRKSYRELMEMGDNIRAFEAKISPSGDYGGRYGNARNEGASLWLQRRRTQAVVEEASAEAAGILATAKKAAAEMLSLLTGILNHGSLSNIERFAARRSKFSQGIADSIEKIQNVIHILEDIEAIEGER
ncbi:MAG: hypothetical protein MdMp014T_0724 [Treponematales bacterium]